MAVYVDNYEAKFGRMKMCHMIADNREELFDMATKIGVKHTWIQYAYSSKEHFDICKAKRKLAIAFGAKEISANEFVQIIRLKQAVREL